jgi:hypothetical protein
MNTGITETEYPDIALVTVAKYAGLNVLDVFAALSQCIEHHHSSVSSSPFPIRHSRALLTVAKFSGIDVATVTKRLWHPEPPIRDNEISHVDKAA